MLGILHSSFSYKHANLLLKTLICAIARILLRSLSQFALVGTFPDGSAQIECQTAFQQDTAVVLEITVGGGEAFSLGKKIES